MKTLEDLGENNTHPKALKARKDAHEKAHQFGGLKKLRHWVKKRWVLWGILLYIGLKTFVPYTEMVAKHKWPVAAGQWARFEVPVGKEIDFDTNGVFFTYMINDDPSTLGRVEHAGERIKFIVAVRSLSLKTDQDTDVRVELKPIGK